MTVEGSHRDLRIIQENGGRTVFVKNQITRSSPDINSKSFRLDVNDEAQNVNQPKKSSTSSARNRAIDHKNNKITSSLKATTKNNQNQLNSDFEHNLALQQQSFSNNTILDPASNSQPLEHLPAAKQQKVVIQAQKIPAGEHSGIRVEELVSRNQGQGLINIKGDQVSFLKSHRSKKGSKVRGNKKKVVEVRSTG